MLYMAENAFLQGKPNILYFKFENLKFFKMISEWFEKFRSSK